MGQVTKTKVVLFVKLEALQDSFNQIVVESGLATRPDLISRDSYVTAYTYCTSPIDKAKPKWRSVAGASSSLLVPALTLEEAFGEPVNPKCCL